jgi:hypothetical protein
MDPQLGAVARGAVDLGAKVGGCAARVARYGGGRGARLGALICGAELGALICGADLGAVICGNDLGSLICGAERGVIKIRAAAVIFSRTLFLSLPSLGSFSPST